MILIFEIIHNITKFNQKGIKPTTDKIRESVFNIIISYLKINGKNGENQFEGFNILDVFAGTGALGLEAISRGAKNVTFIEKSRDNLRVLYKNVDHLKVNENVKIIKRSIRKVKKIEEKFDLIFIDPPYQMNLIIKKTLIVSTRMDLSKVDQNTRKQKDVFKIFI